MREEPSPPVWLPRSFVVVYVLIWRVLGMAGLSLPWTSNWFETGWISRWPLAQELLQQGFVRGAISGLGLIDVWLGVMEAVNYHDRR